MEKQFIEKMREALKATKRELLKTLVANNDDFNAIIQAVDPKDFADIASDDTDRTMLECLGAKDLQRLQQIDSALARIEQGKYGRCIKCNKLISEPRLEAIPYALMCIDCKSAQEKRKRY